MPVLDSSGLVRTQDLDNIDKFIPGFSTKYQFTTDVCCNGISGSYKESKTYDLKDYAIAGIYDGQIHLASTDSLKITYDNYICDGKASTVQTCGIVKDIPTYIGMKPDCTNGFVIGLVGLVVGLAIIGWVLR